MEPVIGQDIRANPSDAAREAVGASPHGNESEAVDRDSETPGIPGRRRRELFALAERFAKFCLVGGSGVAVDMTVLYLLADPARLGWTPELAKVLAAEIAMVNNFLWNEFWTFADLTAASRSLPRRLLRFLKFNLVCSLGLLVALAVFHGGMKWFSLNMYLANFLAILAATLWNFWMNYRFSWMQKGPKKADSAASPSQKSA